jgi:hypothetical protein
MLPIDLLIRHLGSEGFQSKIMHTIKKNDLLRWHEDELGNISIGARNAVEAKIFVDTNAIKPEDRVLFYKKIFEDLSINEQDRHSTELDFAISLLVNIGSNGKHPIPAHLNYMIVEILENLRQRCRNPRLMLQEATLLREIAVKKYYRPDGVTDIFLLERAEAIIAEALDISPNSAYLTAERAAIIGRKVSIEEDDKQAVSLYFSMLNVVEKCRRLDNESYHALDASIKTLLFVHLRMSDTDKANVKVFFINLFSDVELEGIRQDESDRYWGNKQLLFQTVGDDKISDDVFQQLEQQGSSTGYYLRAMDKIPFTSVDKKPLLRQELTPSNEQYIKQAYDYLDGNRKVIFNDYKCLNLYFKLWWLLENKQPLFFKQSAEIVLSNASWEKTIQIVTQLLTLGDPSIDKKNSTLLFIKGLAEFHLNNNKFRETFKELSYNSDYSDHRRVTSWYKTNVVYTGVIKESVNKFTSDKGVFYCQVLKLDIDFQLKDFSIFRKEQGAVMEFIIEFNFRGLIAKPVNQK